MAEKIAYYVSEDTASQIPFAKVGRRLYASVTWKIAEVRQQFGQTRLANYMTDLFEPVEELMQSFSDRRERMRNYREQLEMFGKLRLLSQFPLVDIVGRLQGDGFRQLTPSEQDAYLEKVALARLNHGDPSEVVHARSILDRIQAQRVVEENEHNIALLRGLPSTTI